MVCRTGGHPWIVHIRLTDESLGKMILMVAYLFACEVRLSIHTRHESLCDLLQEPVINLEAVQQRTEMTAIARVTACYGPVGDAYVVAESTPTTLAFSVKRAMIVIVDTDMSMFARQNPAPGKLMGL